jgi:hypothetical protein
MICSTHHRHTTTRTGIIIRTRAGKSDRVEIMVGRGRGRHCLISREASSPGIHTTGARLRDKKVKALAWVLDFFALTCSILEEKMNFQEETE